MRISFVLPGYSEHPIGGFKAAYEYASRLALRGHRVNVVHPHSLTEARGMVAALKRKTWPLRAPWRMLGSVPWFHFRGDVTLRRVPNLHERYIPEGDAVVATAWQTAEAISAYPTGKGRKCCLVADYEHWRLADAHTRERIEQAFRGPLALVSYSPCVTEMLQSLGRTPAAEIHVGVDSEVFGVDVPIQERKSLVCGFPLRLGVSKATWNALAAAALLRSRTSRLCLRAFGRVEPSDVPSWIDYVHRPTDEELRAFYNSLAIFILPSLYEAWPLPPLEAMACGAALVASDSVGVRGYAQHGRTALIVPPERPDCLANAVDALARDDTLRVRLAREGHAIAHSFDWDRAVTSLEALLTTGRKAA